jgi:hypothetical protein
MQDKPTFTDVEMDGAILWRLCKSAPWTEPELERELGLGALDGVARLSAKGLAHRIEGDFVFASVAGRHAHLLDPSYR